MILHYSHFENAVCIWPLASCFKTYPWYLCPTCESWVPAAGGFSSSSCLLDWCCTSCNPFWHQRTTYPPSRLHTLSGHDPQVCVSRSRIWKDIAAVEGWVSVNSVGCSNSQSVFCMLHTPQICSWRHFCCHTKQRMTQPGMDAHAGCHFSQQQPGQSKYLWNSEPVCKAKARPCS